MKDNNPADKYMYEILVETGPLSSHSTSSRVEFILTGEDKESTIRCFNDPERDLFKKGATDAFLMTTPQPLGDLKYEMSPNSIPYICSNYWKFISIKI